MIVCERKREKRGREKKKQCAFEREREEKNLKDVFVCERGRRSEENKIPVCARVYVFV